MQIDHKNIFYPPGGILIWMIIFLELLTFGAALVVMAFYAKEDIGLFHQSRLHLDVTIGTMNTIVLLTSGFFMANSIQLLKNQRYAKARRHLMATMGFGLLFLILKSFEYQTKISAGFLFDTNMFFTFYWMLTLFHVIHVLVGLVILISIYLQVLRRPKELNMENAEAGSAFWHMCDLIWLLIFPVLYLIF